MKNKFNNFFQNTFLSKMKARHFFPVQKRMIFLLFAFFGFSFGAHAQFLKKMAKKIEKKLEPNSSTNDSVTTNVYTYTLQSGTLKIPAAATNYNWFKKGSIFNYKFVNTEPASSFESQQTVRNVYNLDNMIVSEIEIKSSYDNLFVNDGADYLKFKCSDDSIFLDFTTELKKALLKMNPALSLNELADTGFMALPVNMVDGQSLPDVNFSKESGLNDGVVLSTSLTNRKIERKEQLTMPAGKFDCIKISGTRNNTITKEGVTKPSSATAIEYIWLSPKVGIVKQESYSTKGKLNAIQYLTSFK